MFFPMRIALLSRLNMQRHDIVYDRKANAILAQEKRKRDTCPFIVHQRFCRASDPSSITRGQNSPKAYHLFAFLLSEDLLK